MVTRTKKIFVGGLSAPTTLEDVKSYFEQFGPVSKSLQSSYNWNWRTMIVRNNLLRCLIDISARASLINVFA